MLYALSKKKAVARLRYEGSPLAQSVCSPLVEVSLELDIRKVKLYFRLTNSKVFLTPFLTRIPLSCLCIDVFIISCVRHVKFSQNKTPLVKEPHSFPPPTLDSVQTVNQVFLSATCRKNNPCV